MADMKVRIDCAEARCPSAQTEGHFATEEMRRIF
jgi:hypothetical protein